MKTLLLTVLLACVCVPVPALADPNAAGSSRAATPERADATLQESDATASVEAKATARALYDQALVAYDAGRFEQALGLLRQAYALTPAPAFLFNIAQCERKLGHCAAARAAYRDYARQEPDDARRGRAERLRAALETCDAESERAVVKPAPRAAPAPSPPRRDQPAAVPVRPIKADEHKPNRTELTVAKWSIAGAATLAGVAAGYFALDARSASSEVSRATEWTAALSERESDGRRSAKLSWICAGASAALLGTALTLHFQ